VEISGQVGELDGTAFSRYIEYNILLIRNALILDG
jgi:hypothetical protein